MFSHQGLTSQESFAGALEHHFPELHSFPFVCKGSIT